MTKNHVGIVSFLLIVLAVLMDLFFKKSLSEYMFIGLLGLVVAVFSLKTVVETKQIALKRDEIKQANYESRNTQSSSVPRREAGTLQADS